MLWLCFYFPRIAMEVYGDAEQLEQSVAIIEYRRGKAWIYQCNPKAEQLGIRPGMSLATANCLAADLMTRDRSPEKEQRAMQKLAAWCGQFSSHVAIREPAAIVLEVGSCLKLFHGLPGLRQRIQDELSELHYSARYALGPTALAAQHLAHFKVHCWTTDRKKLHQALADLRIDQLLGQDKASRGLKAVGIHTIGELLEMPMASLGKRWGKDFLKFLRALVHDHPAQFDCYEAPSEFFSEVEFASELTGQQMLLFPLRRLLTELSAWLRSRHLQCESLKIRLFHRLQGPSDVFICMSGPCHDAETFLSLARLKLERTRLVAPVLSMQLEAGRISELENNNTDLFRRNTSQRHDLIDRLSAKLGNASVFGISQVEDHRPEFGWKLCKPGEKSSNSTDLYRPTWLYSRPEAIETRGENLWLSGALELLGTPERIEAGWWSHVPASRDYYLARKNDGTRLWVFRDLQNGRWFCHGIFA